MAKLAELYVEIGAKLSKFQKGMADVENKMVKVGQKMTAVGRNLTMKVTLPLLAVGTAAVKMGADFDKAMTESLAIMGDVSDAMRKDMADTALEMSTKTTFAAHELAKAYFFLASAGMDAAQSIKALPVVAKFAQAGAFDLATATDLLTDAQTALGLSSKDATENQKNLTQVADVLVKANTLANASVQQFSESLTNRAAAALVNVNKEMYEGVAVLAAYADKGVKGQVAGMRLAMMLNALDIAARKNQKAWKENGLALFDAQGEMRSIGDIIGDLEGALGDMTTEQRAATLATLGFNVRTKASILTLMGSSEKIKQWTKDLKSAGGTTEKVAKKQMQAFSNQMVQLKNTLVKLGIQIGNVLIPIVKKLADKIVPVIERFSKLSEAKKKTIVKIVGLIAALGPLLLILGKLMVTIPKLIKTVVLLKAALISLSTAGIAIVITGLAIMATYIYKVVEAKRKLREATARAEEQTKKLADKLNDIRKAAGLTGDEFGRLINKYNGNYQALALAIMKGKEGVELQKAMTEYGKKRKEQLGKETEALGSLTEAEKEAKEELERLRLEMIEATKAEGVAEEAIKSWAETLKELGIKTIEEKQKKIIEINETLKKLHAEYKAGKIDLEDYAEAVENLTKEKKELAETLVETVLPAARDLSGVLEAAPEKFKDVEYAGRQTADSLKIDWGKLNEQIEAKWINMISSLITNFTSFKDTIKGLFNAIFNIFADTVAKMVVEWIKGTASMKDVLGGFKKTLGQFAVFFAAWVSVNLIENLLTAFGIIESEFDQMANSMRADLHKITKDSLRAGNAVKKIGDGAKEVYGAVDYMVEFGKAIERVANLIDSLSEKEEISIVAQVSLNEAWEEAIKLLEEYGLEGNEAFIELIKRMRELGLESRAVTNYVLGQLGRIPDALSSLTQPAIQAKDAIADLTQTLGEQTIELNELQEARNAYQQLYLAMGTNIDEAGRLERKIAALNAQLSHTGEDTENYQILIDKIAEAESELTTLNTTIGEQREGLAGLEGDFKRYGELKDLIAQTQSAIEQNTETYEDQRNEIEKAGIVALASFNAMISSGLSWMDTVKEMQGPLSDLKTLYGDLGLDANEALKQLFNIAEVTEEHGRLFDNIEANKEILEALGNSGWLTADIMDRLAGDTLAYYNELKKAGLTGDDALRAMIPTLRKIQEMQEAYGLEVDENTQKLMDEAKALGLMKTEEDKTAKALQTAFSGLVDNLKVIFTDLGDRIESIFAGIGNKISEFAGPSFQKGGTFTVPKPTMIRVHPQERIDIQPFSKLRAGTQAQSPAITIHYAPTIKAIDSQDVYRFMSGKGRDALVKIIRSNVRGVGGDIAGEVRKF